MLDVFSVTTFSWKDCVFASFKAELKAKQLHGVSGFMQISLKLILSKCLALMHTVTRMMKQITGNVWLFLFGWICKTHIWAADAHVSQLFYCWAFSCVEPRVTCWTCRRKQDYELHAQCSDSLTCSTWDRRLLAQLSSAALAPPAGAAEKRCSLQEHISLWWTIEHRGPASSLQTWLITSAAQGM